MSKTGRPLKFETAEELQAAIDIYFAQDRKSEDQPFMPTMAGLALHLGFNSRNSLYNYKERTQFAGVIKNAITQLEAVVERLLLTDSNAAGKIFWLKNHGWKDTQEHEISHGAKDMDDDQLDALAARYVSEINKNDSLECHK
jgi:hypothetical protein